jgi:hypothetical protein
MLHTAQQKTVARYSMQQLLQEMVRLSPSWSEGQIRPGRGVGAVGGFGDETTSVISVIFCHFEMKKAGVCSYIMLCRYGCAMLWPKHIEAKLQGNATNLERRLRTLAFRNPTTQLAAFLNIYI